MLKIGCWLVARGRGWLRRWFQRLLLEKKLEGGLQLKVGAFLDLFGSKTVEARDRPMGLLGALP